MGLNPPQQDQNLFFFKFPSQPKLLQINLFTFITSSIFHIVPLSNISVLNLGGDYGFRVNRYLVPDRVLADKDEEDEAASEQIDTSNDPEDKLSGGNTLHVSMIPMYKVVDAFKYPENTHHSEQLAIQHLK